MQNHMQINFLSLSNNVKNWILFKEVSVLSLPVPIASYLPCGLKYSYSHPFLLTSTLGADT